MKNTEQTDDPFAKATKAIEDIVEGMTPRREDTDANVREQEVRFLKAHVSALEAEATVLRDLLSLVVARVHLDDAAGEPRFAGLSDEDMQKLTGGIAGMKT